MAAPKFAPNPGKKLTIDVRGVIYRRLPIKSDIIMPGQDLLKTLDQLVKPHLQSGDWLFISEKVLCVAQNRIINWNDIQVTPLARFLSRRIKTGYKTKDFKGFGHSTPMAMQLFIEEAGVPRVIFAAGVAAVTKPLGIKGLFYRICGKMAKSVDCPMSFSILPFAHYAKRSPLDPSGFARQAATHLGCREVVILDANYQGAFSLGKSSRALSEKMIGQLFADNPLGQSDELTPFCIVRPA